MFARRSTRFAWALVALTSMGMSAGCDSDTDPQGQDYEETTVTAMHDSIDGDIDELILAAQALQAAAPTPAGRGWDPVQDADAIANMKQAWIDARVAYEHVEGALAPLFPDIDFAIDARYDDYLADLGPDDDMFDDVGVTGMHGAERVIFSDETPADVIALEATLVGYQEARFPSTEAEAKAFKEELLAKIVADAQRLKEQWVPANIDLPGAFTGLVDLMNEQREKVNKAASQEQESRYSQRTMADLRANLEGTRKIYAVFQPWLQSLEGGAAIDTRIEAGFSNLESVYETVEGDAIPDPPSDWSAESPSEENLATPFGKLYKAVGDAVDPNQDGSIVAEMTEAGEALGLAQ